MPEFFSDICPELGTLDYDAYDFFRADWHHARQLSFVLTDGPDPDAPLVIDPVVREEWRAELLFELELTRLRRPRDSVLRMLGPGNWEGFISDLYSILTTRFWNPGQRIRELSQIVDMPCGTNELFDRWPRHGGWGFYYPGQFSPSLWNWRANLRARRFALNTIRCGLEDFFGWPRPTSTRRPFPGYIEKPEGFGFYYNLTSPIEDNFGHELVIYGCGLRGAQEADWFRQRVEDWPPDVKSYVLRVKLEEFEGK